MAAYLEQHKHDEAELLWRELQAQPLRNTYGYFMAGLGYALATAKTPLAVELANKSQKFFPDSQEMLGLRLAVSRKMNTHDPVSDIVTTCRFLSTGPSRNLDTMREVVYGWARAGVAPDVYARLMTSLQDRCPSVIYWDVRSLSKLWHMDPRQVIFPSRLTSGLPKDQLRALAISMLGTGRWKLAAKAFEAMLERSQQDSVLLADAYYYSGRHKEAETLYSAALQVSPDPMTVARAALNCAKQRSGLCMVALSKLALVPMPQRADLLSIEDLPPRVRAVFMYASFVTTPNAPAETPPLMTSILWQNWFTADPLSARSITRGYSGTRRVVRAARKKTDLVSLLLQDMEIDVRSESAIFPPEEQLFTESIEQGARTARAFATEFLLASQQVLPELKLAFMRKPHGEIAVLVGSKDGLQVLDFAKDLEAEPVDAETWQKQQIDAWLGGREDVQISQLPYFKPLGENGFKAEAFYQLATHRAYRGYEFEQAIQILKEKALVLDPSYQDGWYRLAEFSFLKDKNAECKKAAEKARDLDPLDKRIDALLTQCSGRKGK